MVDSVADLLARLTFVSQKVETIYLNNDRVHDDFIGQLGAIESFTRGANKEGKIELPILKAGGGIGADAGVHWNMTDPTAQALVLRAALESQDMLRGADNAEPGDYVYASGTGRLSRPGTLHDEHRSHLAARPGLYEELEADRANQEKVYAVMGGTDAEQCWLMTIDDGHRIAAAVLAKRWIAGGMPTWLGVPAPWNVFARARRRLEQGGVVLAAIHVTVRLGP
jgi:hypothetical protein